MNEVARRTLCITLLFFVTSSVIGVADSAASLPPIGDSDFALAATGVASPEGDPWRRPVLFTRAVFVLMALGAIGGAMFVALLAPARPVRSFTAALTRWQAGIALLLVPALLALSGAQIKGGAPDVLWQLDTWRTAAFGATGQSLSMAALGLAAVAWRTGGADIGGARWIVALGVAAVASSRAVTGHASAAWPVTLMAVLVSLHFVAAAFWVGSLLPLYRAAMPANVDQAAALVERFSRLAAYAVAALLLAGVAMAYIHVGSVAALTGTYYGRVLLGKTATVALLLLLATANKYWLGRRIAPGVANSGRPLRVAIAIEMFLMLNVIAATGSLTSTPTPAAALSVAATAVTARG